MPHKSSTGSFTGRLNVNSEEATPGCWPSRQSSSVQCLCSSAHLNLFFYWPVWDTLPRRPASCTRLFTVDVETGVLWVLFNEAASWGLVRRLFLNLDTLNVLVLLLSCAPDRASLLCSVKGVVHSIVRDLQFLGNFSHGIALISQNKNRLKFWSFRRKSLFLAILIL